MVVNDSDEVHPVDTVDGWNPANSWYSTVISRVISGGFRREGDGTEDEWYARTQAVVIYSVPSSDFCLLPKDLVKASEKFIRIQKKFTNLEFPEIRFFFEGSICI